MLEALYRIRDVRRWEEELGNALRNRYEWVLEVLIEYLPSLPTEYVPRDPLVREFLSHIKYLVMKCEEHVDTWINAPSCKELRSLINEVLKDIHPSRSSYISKVISDGKLIKLVAKSFGVPWQ